MFKLAPSILSADFGYLAEELKMIESAGAQYVHIDVMDGGFVPNISMGLPVIKSIRKVTDMVFDVHLMINNPERYITKFAEAGADIINVHIEACENIMDTLDLIKKENKKAALTVKPNTDIKEVFPYLKYLDMVLIMSVEPGAGGQKFIETSLDKVRMLKREVENQKLNIDIEIDGGITLTNAKEVINSGANILVAGSSVFGANNPGEAIQEFLNIFESCK